MSEQKVDSLSGHWEGKLVNEMAVLVSKNLKIYGLFGSPDTKRQSIFCMTNF